MRKIFFITILISIIALSNISVLAFPPSNNNLYNGIDVSEWQGDIDFKKVGQQGVEVVYIRVSEGQKYTDPYFKDNYEKAKQNGLKVGFYHFLTAKNTEEAIEEARFFVANIKGLKPDCKLAMDFEVFNELGKTEINNISEAFLNTVETLSGKQCVIYSDANNAKEIFSEELAKDYPIWVADYYVEEPEDNGKWNSWVGFQYTNRGEINGINGNVDRDYFTEGIFLADTTNIPTNTTPTIRENFKYIEIKRGDTLSKIAMEYNTSYQYLAKINNIKNPNLIYAGQTLKVPKLENNNINDTNHILYIVRSGNTLSGISREYGVSINSIVQLNNIENPNLIYVGEILRIPRN